MVDTPSMVFDIYKNRLLLSMEETKKVIDYIKDCNESYLSEAFKGLSLLEDDINLSSVGDDLDDELSAMVSDDVEAPVDEIVDINADEETELSDTYEGKVILECNCCHSRIYKDGEEVIIEEDTANPDDECPVCGNTCGYTVIGKIQKFDDNKEVEPEEDEDDEHEDEEEKNESLTEGAMSLKDRLARKHLFDAEESLDEEPIEESAINEDNWDKLTDAYPELEDGEVHEELEESDDLWDEHDFDNLEPDEIEELKASVDKYGVVRNKDVYNDIRKLQRERQNEALCEDDICPECGKNPCECKEDDDIEEGCKVNESVEVHADGEDKVDVAKNDDGSMTINVGEAEVEGEAIVPLTDEDQAALEANSEEEIAEEPVEEVPEEEAPIEDGFEEEPTEEVQEESLDTTIEDFDERKFNDLAEGFLRKVYENVNTFETTSVKDDGDNFIVEGLIKYKSGKAANSTFTFNNAYISKRGNLVMEGFNETFSKSNKSFRIHGSFENNNFIAESMSYNYKVTQLNESNQNETVLVSGRVKAR